MIDGIQFYTILLLIFGLIRSGIGLGVIISTGDEDDIASYVVFFIFSLVILSPIIGRIFGWW